MVPTMAATEEEASPLKSGKKYTANPIDPFTVCALAAYLIFTFTLIMYMLLLNVANEPIPQHVGVQRHHGMRKCIADAETTSIQV
jgi:hypothetical protein